MIAYASKTLITYDIVERTEMIMKILVLNGSPRKGNSKAAIDAFVEGASANNDVEVLDTYKVKVGPCMGCGACECHKGCVAQDDTNTVIDKLVAADVIVFATPVYWWGITAQMKMVVDKIYCRAGLMKGKRIGVIVIGGSPVGSEQYELIQRQFGCIASYLEWNTLFHKDYAASATDDLVKNAEAMSELKAAGAAIK